MKGYYTWDFTENPKPAKDWIQENYDKPIEMNADNNWICPPVHAWGGEKVGWRVVSDLIFERELERADFKAYQDCPACLKFGFFLMDKVYKIDKNGYVMRVCSHCGHRWKQK